MPLITLSQYDPIYVDNNPECFGFSDTLSNQVDYVETLTEVIAFRDNYILNEIPEDIYTWYNTIVSSGDGFDLTELWDLYHEWNSYNLVDLEKDINQFETITFQDTTIQWNIIVYEEWEITIWDYTRIWDDDYIWIFEGKSTGIQLSADDAFGFSDDLTSTFIYADINLSDIIGFTHSFPYVDAAIFLSDYFGIIEDTNYLGLTTQINITDIIGYNDTPLHSCILAQSIALDIFGLQDTALSPWTFWYYLFEDCGFIESKLYTRDHIVYWRGRTQHYVMGFGGGPYGDFEYGGGELTDLKEYRIQVFKGASEVLLRDVIRPITDYTESSPFFVYSWKDNVDDNTFYNHYLKFGVSEISSKGICSEINSVYGDYLSTPLDISGCITWCAVDLSTNISSNYYLLGGNYLKNFIDMSGYGNNFIGYLYLSGNPTLNGKPTARSFYDYYNWNGASQPSSGMNGRTGQLSIFWVGLQTSGSQYCYGVYGLDLSNNYTHLGYKDSLMDEFKFGNGWIYKGDNALDNQFHIWSASTLGVNKNTKVYRDGSLLASNSNATFVPSYLHINGFYGTCYIAEIIVYNRVLDFIEMDSVHEYLNNKYNII